MTVRSWTCGLAMLCLALAAPALASPASGAAEPAPQIKAAIDGVLQLFESKSVVALGDAHGLAQEEDFYSALVRDPRFATQVGNVVVEFGGAAAQEIVDRYVAGENVPFTELRRVWTDVVGWFPGETQLVGLVNFFASVRAANLNRPAEQRIKVWLGDPNIDWSRARSFQDVQPLLRQRDEHFFQILGEELLEKHKKALVIVGLGHLFGPGGPGPLSSRINQAYPGSLAIVAPFIGYLEPECNARFAARARSWPVPAIAGPISGTALKSQLQLSGCHYLPPAQIEHMKKMSGPPPEALLGGGPAPSPADMITAQLDILSGVRADAILYLGPPESLTQSPTEPSTYLDPDYFEELSRRSQCCTPGGRPLDWQQMLLQGSANEKKYEAR